MNDSPPPLHPTYSHFFFLPGKEAFGAEMGKGAKMLVISASAMTLGGFRWTFLYVHYLGFLFLGEIDAQTARSRCVKPTNIGNQ